MYCDGAASPNPGPAYIGVVIFNEAGKPITQISDSIGRSTSNKREHPQAE